LLSKLLGSIANGSQEKGRKEEGHEEEEEVSRRKTPLRRGFSHPDPTDLKSSEAKAGDPEEVAQIIFGVRRATTDRCRARFSA
jgi:hypothetical protein